MAQEGTGQAAATVGKGGRRFRPMLANLLLLTSVTAVSVLLAEWTVRTFLSDRVVLFPRYHSKVKYGDYTLRRFRPNTVFHHTSLDGTWEFVINAQGFRSTENYQYAKPPGVLRVLVLGDSHTSGSEVRQGRTFSAILERRLAAMGIPAQVMNTGLNGFGNADELLFLRNEGVRYQPDVVVLGFFANDFEDNVKSRLFAMNKDELVETGKEFAPGTAILDVINRFAAIRWLSENSYLYSLALNTVWERTKRLLIKKSLAEAQTEYAIPTETLSDYKIRLAEALVGEMHQASRKIGATFILLDVPQVDIVQDTRDFKSSIPESTRAAFRRNADHLLDSESVLGAYHGLTEFHVAHGSQHINESTHLVLGMALADAIAGSTPGAAKAGSHACACGKVAGQ